MNERIFELAIKSGHIVGQLPLNTNEKIQLAGLEKFAELIVRECADFVSNDRQNDDYGVFVANRIKEHFGVQE